MTDSTKWHLLTTVRLEAFSVHSPRRSDKADRSSLSQVITSQHKVTRSEVVGPAAFPQSSRKWHRSRHRRMWQFQCVFCHDVIRGPDPFHVNVTVTPVPAVTSLHLGDTKAGLWQGNVTPSIGGDVNAVTAAAGDTVTDAGDASCECDGDNDTWRYRKLTLICYKSPIACNVSSASETRSRWINHMDTGQSSTSHTHTQQQWPVCCYFNLIWLWILIQTNVFW